MVALIGLLGSIAGVAIGAGLTQTFNEKTKQIDARGDARVLDEAFLAADDAMNRSLIDNRYRFYKLTIDLPFEDEKQLSTHLNASQYDKVARAEALVALQQARSLEPRAAGYSFGEDDRIQIWCDRAALAKARLALRQFSGLPDTAADQDLRHFSRTCSAGIAGHPV